MTRHVPDLELPERIDLGDIVIRRWTPDDLLPRYTAIMESIDTLRPWLAWYAEPVTLERMREHEERLGGSWPSPEGSFSYGIFDPSGTVLGAIGLHDNTAAKTLQIGYWCHVDHVGRGIVTRSATALLEIALASPLVGRVELRCDPANTRSRAVAQRLGCRFDRMADASDCPAGGSGTEMVWVAERAPA